MKKFTFQAVHTCTVAVTKPQCFTTGAFISPQSILINGETKWVWVIDEIENDTFIDGDYVSINVIADTAEGLINLEEE